MLAVNAEGAEEPLEHGESNDLLFVAIVGGGGEVARPQLVNYDQWEQKYKAGERQFGFVNISAI
jgi:hypothetical protein